MDLEALKQDLKQLNRNGELQKIQPLLDKYGVQRLSPDLSYTVLYRALTMQNVEWLEKLLQDPRIDPSYDDYEIAIDASKRGSAYFDVIKESPRVRIDHRLMDVLYTTTDPSISKRFYNVLSHPNIDLSKDNDKNRSVLQNLTINICSSLAESSDEQIAFNMFDAFVSHPTFKPASLPLAIAIKIIMYQVYDTYWDDIKEGTEYADRVITFSKYRNCMSRCAMLLSYLTKTTVEYDGKKARLNNGEIIDFFTGDVELSTEKVMHAVNKFILGVIPSTEVDYNAFLKWVKDLFEIAKDPVQMDALQDLMEF